MQGELGIFNCVSCQYQFHFNEIQVESEPNNFLKYYSTSGVESPSEIKVTEVEIPASVLMEDNSSVEKAEEYMKELEDVSDVNIFVIYIN